MRYASVIQSLIQLQRKERVGGFKRAISGEVSLSQGRANTNTNTIIDKNTKVSFILGGQLKQRRE